MNRVEFANFERIDRLVQSSGLDAIIVTSPENITYYSGFYDMDLPQLPGVHFVINPVQGEPVLITHARGVGFGNIECFLKDVRVYNDSYLWHSEWGKPDPTAVEVFAQTIKEMGLAKSRMGLEMRRLGALYFKQIEALLPDATFVDTTEESDMVRSVKTPAEIELYRRAAWATNKAIVTAYELARPGDLEKDVADTIGYTVARFGADLVHFNVMASGERLPLGHHFAESVPIQYGDLLRVDYGAMFSGYLTDMVRMAVVGKPCSRQQSIYSKVVEIHYDMVDQVRPGADPGPPLQESTPDVC